MNRRYRLLFLDLDGTLVDHTDVVSPRVRRALRDARESGCTLVLCTARNRYTVEPVAAQIGGQGYGIFTNGAVIGDRESGHVFHKVTLPRAAVAHAVDLAHAAGLAPLLHGVRVEEDGGRSVVTTTRGRLPDFYAAPNRDRLSFCADPAAERLLPVSMSVYGHEDEMRALAEAWRQRLGPEVAVFEDTSRRYGCATTYCHARAANKERAARWVAHTLGVAREETLAIGDGLNDLELLRWAGLGVCMADGHADARACAAHVTGCLADDGVAQAIERFILTQ